MKKIGAIARPDDILFTADLPKTRSGKIMRRLLRDIAEGKALGDTTTLADPARGREAEGELRRGARLGVAIPFASASNARCRHRARGAEPGRLEPGTSEPRPPYLSYEPMALIETVDSGRPT